MYPNPQDVLPLPARPDVEQYRTRARDLHKACLSGTPGALRVWTTRWLSDLARLAPEGQSMSARDAERLTNEITAYAHAHLTRAGCALSEAQFIIARAHGFPSWPKLVRHLDALPQSRSDVSTFERAADAITRGDLATLDQLVRADPALMRARSTREHRATLLHYVAANGVENYRQRTPANIVEIARLLLDAGAEVDAEADVYGGGATTLGLVVTSAHPRQMGVQNALADLLLDRGARMGAPVRDCLMNGCPEAAQHLVHRGAPVRTMEEAAGIGRVDLLEALWDERRPANGQAALRMAAWYGRRDVAAWLLERGVDPASRDPRDGDTTLHIASYNGHAELVALLLPRGVDVNAVDEVYRTPPLVWALHGWLVENRPHADAYRSILHQLVTAGARVDPAWIDDERLRTDPELMALLTSATL